VNDAAGQALAYVYFEDEKGRRDVMKRLTKDEARRIAVNIAKLPTLVAKGGVVPYRQFVHATSPCLRAGCKQSVPRCHYGRPTKKAPRRSAGPRIHSRSQHAQRGARGKKVFVADSSAPATLCRRAFSDSKLAKEEPHTRTRCPSSTITPAAIVLLGQCWAMGHASRWPGWVGGKNFAVRRFSTCPFSTGRPL
jgi:hypothetical protein